MANTQGRDKAAAAAAVEKELNIFVHLVAIIERVGNALGTLAFTWATVILLGGYPTVLRPDYDFGFATIIVFLEAFRMFSRENKQDYQLFFSTKGAFRPLGLNGLLILLVYFSVALVLIIKKHVDLLLGLVVDMAVVFAIGLILSPRALKLVGNPLRRAMSLWSPLVAIGLAGWCILEKSDKKSNAKLIWYPVLLLLVLLTTITRLRFPCIVNLVSRVLSSRQLGWRQVILNSCMLAAIVMLLLTFDDEKYFIHPVVLMVCQVAALVLVSFGNLQIPTAVVRVVLASLRLKKHDYNCTFTDDGTENGTTQCEDTNSYKNLVPSMNIFYGMVLGQGVLYIMACMLEVFSFIPRRRLIQRAGFRGKMGVKYVNMYYAYALDKCMGGAVLAPRKTSLITFAMDSLNSDSSMNKLYGVQVMHNFLKKDQQVTTRTIPKLTSSNETVTTLFNMLAWTSDADAEIRLFAAKVTAELAGSLLIAPFPGAIQQVVSLLNSDITPKMMDHFLLIDIREEREEGPSNQEVGTELKYWKKMAIYCLIPVDEPPQMERHDSSIFRCWKQMTKCWSIQEEEPSTDKDCLPVQGLLILERLANYDVGNCMEIGRATGLISKLIDFTSYGNSVTGINTEAQQIMLVGLSLKVLTRLASTKGKLGVSLRQQILEDPFVLCNLGEILSDRGSNLELREMAAEILKNFAMDRRTSEDIGRFRMIINTLMHEFLTRGASTRTDSSQLLQRISGQTLAMLTMESASNCLAMLNEPGCVFIKELTIMIHDNRNKYTAASLLRNICEHARHEISNSEQNNLCHILREVLEGIMDVKGAELEVLISLSSQICKAIPDDFARELEDGQIRERFIERLVGALNANMRSSAHCPGIRRVIIEHAIHLMELNSRYANDFTKYRMVEALSLVESIPSRAENYRMFSGDAGLMEHSTKFSDLLDRAKELMARGWVRGISGTAH